MKTTTAVAALSLVVATGCSRKGAGGPARIPVTVARAEQRAVPYEIIATGTVEPRQTVSVQSQVTGVLTQVAFREGDDVAAGQVLFQIDPRPFQAALDQARAMLARDQAQAQSAVLDAQRYAELVKQDYVTKSDYEAKRAAAEALQAVVRADSAAVASAALNLDWATIRAPIAGRTGRLLVREGNLVRANANATDPLVVINQIHPILVRFAVPEAPLEDRHRVHRGDAHVRRQQRRHDDRDRAAQGGVRQPRQRAVAGRIPEHAAAAVHRRQGAGGPVTGGDERAAGQLSVRGQPGRHGAFPTRDRRAHRRRLRGPRAGSRGRGWRAAGRRGRDRRAAAARRRRARRGERRGRARARAGGRQISLSELFIKRPVMTTLVMMGILLFGIMAYRLLPVSDLPNVDFPTITVNASLPGASPETMASAVATPLEKQFSTIAGLDQMTSTSNLGSTSITLQFTLDRDIDAAAQDVQAAISKTLRQLPSAILPPTYQKVNPADSPIVYYALSSHTLSLSALDEYAETFIAQRLSTVSGVAQVQVYVASKNGAPVRLQDVGQVLDDVQDNKSAAWFNGNRAIVLAVQRQPGTNTVAVAGRVRTVMARLKQQLPASVDLQLRYDRSDSIQASLSDVRFTLLLTLCLVVLVIFLFLRNLSATIIPSLALPFSLVGTFTVMYQLGYSLDNLSMMALTLSVGFVVDDAIVMLENIVRHMEHGTPPLRAAFDGAREVGFTILSMTLSLAAVFLPVLFMGGIIGRLFHEFAVTIGAAILVSGVVSLTLTPMLCSRFLRAAGREQHGRLYQASERVYEKTLRWYERSLEWVMQRRPAALAFSIAILAATVVLFAVTPKGFLPSEDNAQIFGITETLQGTSFDDMVAHQQQVMAVLQQEPGVTGVMSFLGGGTINQGRVFLQLKPRSQRKMSEPDHPRLRG